MKTDAVDMPAPILLDLSHTSHTRALTGVQRVTRALLAKLGSRARPVCHDPFLGGWRPLAPWELANLASTSGAGRRGARWPVRARLRGYLGRLRSAPRNDIGTQASACLCPEIFSPEVGDALPRLFNQVRGPRVAIFHDALALQFPEFASPATARRYPAYLQELLAFDGVAAVSETSRAVLLDYWRWLGVRDAPPVVAIPLGVDLPDRESPPESRAGPVVLCVGTIEGRKNHLALLDACEELWNEGRRFELRLLGLARPQTARAALDRIAQLARAGRPIRYDGIADERTLADAYAEAAFTVYPSLIEGFGLPVAESLAHGKPCVCSSQGALGEISRGGGCLALDVMDRPHLAAAIGRLLADAGELGRLAAAARARPLRSWADYASDVASWLETLTRRRANAFQNPLGQTLPTSAAPL